jgi:hypothetical protein
MTRKSRERQRAVLIRRTKGELETQRAALLAELDGCDNPECLCAAHHDAWQQLDTVRFLLGEDDDPGPRLDRREDES